MKAGENSRRISLAQKIPFLTGGDIHNYERENPLFSHRTSNSALS
jgi:hypothetical protein